MASTWQCTKCLSNSIENRPHLCCKGIIYSLIPQDSCNRDDPPRTPSLLTNPHVGVVVPTPAAPIPTALLFLLLAPLSFVPGVVGLFSPPLLAFLALVGGTAIFGRGVGGADALGVRV